MTGPMDSVLRLLRSRISASERTCQIIMASAPEPMGLVRTRHAARILSGSRRYREPSTLLYPRIATRAWPVLDAVDTMDTHGGAQMKAVVPATNASARTICAR